MKISNIKLYYFTEKYEFVGKLLKPGEEPNNYSDEEDEKEKEKVAIESPEDKKKEWNFVFDSHSYL